MGKTKTKSSKRAASGYRRFAQDNSISAAGKAKSDGVSHYTVLGAWWKGLDEETKKSYNEDKAFVHKVPADAVAKKIVAKGKAKKAVVEAAEE